MDIPLLKSGNQNGNDNNTNKIARAIDTIIKSINHARNLSTQLANITSTGRLSASPILDTGGESLFDEDNYQVKFSRYTYMILFFKERKDVNMGVNIGVDGTKPKKFFGDTKNDSKRFFILFFFIFIVARRFCIVQYCLMLTLFFSFKTLMTITDLVITPRFK